MSLCPAQLCLADTQAGFLGSAAQSVQVSGGLESLGEAQALARVSGCVWGRIASFGPTGSPLN